MTLNEASETVFNPNEVRERSFGTIPTECVNGASEQSQRDCVPQPKVAVLSYLGSPEREGPNPKGVAPLPSPE